MRALTFLFLFFASSITFGQNIMISNQGSPNEPTIIIDPKRPNFLVAGANLKRVYTSVDTGKTWKEDSLASSYGVWGDPVLAVDTSSNVYYFHLSNSIPIMGNWIDRIVCQKFGNNSVKWTNGSFVGLNGTKAQDKQWCSIDRTNNNIYLTWTQFDRYGSTNKNDSSIILFSKSVDGGETWNTPQRISKSAGDCVDSDSTVEGAVPAIGPNGEIYVSWASAKGIVFNKSIDQGDTWLKEESIIVNTPGGWNFDIPGIYRANGLPITVCDRSNGLNRGTIYVNWSDQRNGISNTDVWLIKSTDDGRTWSTPTRVNDDTSNHHQFFTWMAIDQTNGYLYFVFYDRRNHDNDSTDVYLAISTDGGNSFINKKISESPFLPDKNIFFGDYTNLSVHNGIIRPIWTRLNNGKLSIWTSLLNLNDLLGSEIQPNTSANLEFENYPNPSHDYTFISFKLHTLSTVNLTVYSLEGKKISTIIDDEKRGYGKYVERIDLQNLNLSSGIYIFNLKIDGITKQVKHIKI